MAKKTFCDCCGNEITDIRAYPYVVMYHIVNPNKSHSKVIDGQFQPMSGRELHLDMCLECYNEHAFESYEAFKKLHQKKIGNEK